MTAITRILCPVDFSDASKHALTHAVALARWYSARLTVQHVYRIAIPAAALSPGMGSIGAEAVMMATVDEGALRADLERFVRSVASDLTVEYLIAEGDAANAIAAAAKGYSLIVLGTHGRSGFERLILGSVTEKVLRKAPCAVLTIPPASSGPASSPVAPRLFARIVVATDFSAASDQAVRYALSLAREADAHLTVVHVLTIPDTAGEWLYGREAEDLVRDATDTARQLLAKAVPAAAREGCTVVERLEKGKPYERIVNLATTDNAGLIVLGAHGHGMVDQLFFGSTAQHVVRQAHCPVLTVRP